MESQVVTRPWLPGLHAPWCQLRSAGAAVIFVTYATQLLLNGLQLPVGFWLLARFPAEPSKAEQS